MIAVRERTRQRERELVFLSAVDEMDEIITHFILEECSTFRYTSATLLPLITGSGRAG